MIRAQRHLLAPTPAQDQLLRRTCGVARKAWNWAVAIAREAIQTGQPWPSSAALQKRWNAVKAVEFPYVSEVTKLGPEQAFRALDKARTAWRERRSPPATTWSRSPVPLPPSPP